MKPSPLTYPFPTEPGRLLADAFSYYQAQTWVPHADTSDAFTAGISWMLWALERTGDEQTFNQLISVVHQSLQHWLVERGDPEALFRIFEEMSGRQTPDTEH